jgi:hypothetical protein
VNKAQVMRRRLIEFELALRDAQLAAARAALADDKSAYWRGGGRQNPARDERGRFVREDASQAG